MKAPIFRSRVLLAGLLLLSTSIQAATIGYWRFEEGTANTPAAGVGTIVDSSINNNAGSPTGSPIYRPIVGADPIPQTGSPNALSLEFNGNDYVSISHAANLDPLDGFTVEFWVNISSSESGLYLVADKSHGFTDSTGWVFQGSNASFLFGVGVGGAGGGNFATASSTTDLRDDTWHHIAGIYDSSNTGQEVSLYIDGLLDNTTTSSAYVSNTRDINIGASWGGGTFTRFLNGSVDELRISDEVLAPSQFLNAPAQNPVPEPATLPLYIAALLGFGRILRRRR